VSLAFCEATAGQSLLSLLLEVMASDLVMTESDSVMMTESDSMTKEIARHEQ